MQFDQEVAYLSYMERWKLTLQMLLSRRELVRFLEKQFLQYVREIRRQDGIELLLSDPKLKSYDTKRPLQRNGRFFGVKTRGQKCSCLFAQPAPVICSVTAQVQLTVLKTSQKVQLMRIKHSPKVQVIIKIKYARKILFSSIYYDIILNK